MKTLGSMIAIALTVGFGMSASVQAGGYDGFYDFDTDQHRFERRVDRRQERQWDRISRGIESGELSRGEARKLKKQQRRIARLERKFERDGYYSPREKQKMERALDRASKRIRRAKHNDVHGYGHRHGWKQFVHDHWSEPYYYEPAGKDYSGSIASITAKNGGFTISWGRSHQY